jgi:hypothetical protein
MKWKSKGSALTTGIRKRGSKHAIQTFNFTEMISDFYRSKYSIHQSIEHSCGGKTKQNKNNNDNFESLEEIGTCHGIKSRRSL